MVSGDECKVLTRCTVVSDMYEWEQKRATFHCQSSLLRTEMAVLKKYGGLLSS